MVNETAVSSVFAGLRSMEQEKVSRIRIAAKQERNPVILFFMAIPPCSL